MNGEHASLPVRRIEGVLCWAQVGLLDIDICGPSVPKMMGLEGQEIHQSAAGWSPVYVDTQDGTLGVMSIGARQGFEVKVGLGPGWG